MAGRAAARSDEDRGRPARDFGLERGRGALPRDAVRADLGVRLRDVLPFARCLHRLPAGEAGGGRRPPHRPDRTGRGVRGQGGMSLRWRIASILALVALGVGAFAAVASYLTTASELRAGIDDTLQSRAAAGNA